MYLKTFFHEGVRGHHQIGKEVHSIKKKRWNKVSRHLFCSLLHCSVLKVVYNGIADPYGENVRDSGLLHICFLSESR